MNAWSHKWKNSLQVAYLINSYPKTPSTGRSSVSIVEGALSQATSLAPRCVHAGHTDTNLCQKQRKCWTCDLHHKATVPTLPSWGPALSRHRHDPASTLCCFPFCWASGELLPSNSRGLFHCNFSDLYSTSTNLLLFYYKTAILYFYSPSRPAGSTAPCAIPLGLGFGRSCFYSPVAS